MLALGVIFLIEYLDDVLKDPDDVQTALGLTTLGAVPVVEGNGADSGLVTLVSGHSPAIEAYRVLRTNLQFAAVGRPLRSLLVTSASPSEGKSLTSTNLAIALAQGGRRAILIDCDLHRPRLHRLLKLPNNLGLTTALVDAGADLASLLQTCEVPGLRVMTSGPLAPNPAEILGSARMREVLAGLVELADIVIVDSPPILAVADAAILASEIDGVLMVLDAGTTRREIAQRALASLQQVQAGVIGAVLNRVPRRRSGYYYYYYNHDYNTDAGPIQRSAHRRWPWQKAGRQRASEVVFPITPGK
jgi:succinoglycan biosynthesis transport protein ExoP